MRVAHGPAADLGAGTGWLSFRLAQIGYQVLAVDASRDADWTDPEVWEAANPNGGVTIREDFLREECQRAIETPAFENTFKRLYLNMRTEQSVRLIPMDQWDACAEPVDPQSPVNFLGCRSQFEQNAPPVDHQESIPALRHQSTRELSHIPNQPLQKTS